MVVKNWVYIYIYRDMYIYIIYIHVYVSVNSQLFPIFKYFQVMAGSRAAGQDLVDARLCRFRWALGDVKIYRNNEKPVGKWENHRKTIGKPMGK